MIEAITASVSNSQLVRQVAEQNSTLQSYSSNPQRVQAAAVSAPYLSPHVNLNGGSPIFVIRDSETGEYLRQFPTEGQMKSYQKAQVNAQEHAAIQKAIVSGGSSAVASTPEEAAAAELVKNSVEYRQVRSEAKVQQQSFVPVAGNFGSSTGDVKTEKPQAKVITSLDTQA